MPKGPDAIVNPELLVWARESMGLSIEEVALKVKKDVEVVTKWELGEERPTISKLRDLARIYKRPLAIFYLSKPPKKFEPLNDYRRFPEQVDQQITPELKFSIREAFEKRELLLELSDSIGEDFQVFPLKTGINEPPEDVASIIREFLNVDFDTQHKLKDENSAFNYWRKNLESIGVLVFQARRIEPNLMRGFSICELPFPVIVVNNKDRWGRIFTLFHELTHIMLHESSICDLAHASDLPPEKRNVEVFCNHVAGAVLVPRDILLSNELVINKSPSSKWPDDDINQLILRRLLMYNKITNRFYKEKRKQYHDELIKRKEEEEKKKKIIRIKMHDLIPSLISHSFIRIILNGYYQDKLTLNDVSDYLNVKIKHIPKIEEKVFS
jgi:Zn-dependent peptidase ImmA (M78 family)